MTKISRNIHDKTFNALMHHKTYVSALIKTHLPTELVSQIDWNTFEINRMEGKHIRTDLTGEAHADVLCRAKIGEDQGFFYLHAEHQSTSDPLIAVRILNYQTNFLLDYSKAHPKEKLPLLISILYYHSKSAPFSVSLNWLDAFEQPELAKIYTSQPFLIDVSSREDQAIKCAPSEIAATEFIFKYIRMNDFTPHLTQVMALLKETPSQIRQIALKYLLCAAQLEEETFIKTVHQYLPHDEEYIMNIARQREETGFQHGIQEGRQEGILEGRQEGILEGILEGRQEGRQEGIQEGRQEGILEGQKQTAKNMLVLGYELSAIACVTKLLPNFIQKLQKELETA